MHHLQALSHRLESCAGLWFVAEKPHKHVAFQMDSADQTLTSECPSPLRLSGTSALDLTARLSDALLLRILAAVPEPLRLHASLVCKRWLLLVGRLRRSLTVLDWSFVDSRRLFLRFPELTDLDLVPASFDAPSPGDGILISKGYISVALDAHADLPVCDCHFLQQDVLDRGLDAIARNFSGLQKLSLVAAASESSLLAIAEACDVLQELELHGCCDPTVRHIFAFENLQILRLVGSVEGLYRGPGVTDIGLTLLAHGCKRLVKLELGGCEGSYDGIAAIGRCCTMLEELTITEHQMDGGWTAALSFCGNLKKLRLHNCRKIDSDPGPLEHLGTCPTIQTLELQQCQLRDKGSLLSLFMVCEAVRDIMFKICWGLDDNMFSLVSICRRVTSLSLEGCSLLTTKGFETVVLFWIDLKRLVVVSCNSIKDDEVSPALSNLFPVLKVLKWRPDSKSILATSLAGTGMGNKGGKFFRS